MNNGYIKLHRKILDWQWFNDSNTFRLFIYLLLTANIEDKMWQNVKVNRGQLITSREHLAQATSLSVQQVRTSLNKLKSSQEITIKTTNKYTLITIVKYNDYQDSIQNNNQQITNKQPTNNQQITTTKEYKNIRNIYSSSIVSEYEKNIGTLNGIVLEELESYTEDLTKEMIIEAIHIASRNNKHSWSYIKAILDRWLRNGYKTIADIQNDRKVDSETELREQRLKLLEGL